MKTHLGNAAKEDTQKRLFDKNLWNLRDACMKNAKLLLSEASFLYRQKHYARAFFLAYSSLEELGKYLVVCDHITGMASSSEFQEAFKAHTLKIAYAHNNAQLVFDRNRKVTGAILVYDRAKYKEWTKYRNQSLYVGIDELNRPLMPSQHVDITTAKKMIERSRKEIRTIIEMEAISEQIGSAAFYK
jgi:AbiV family abortive infection protein